MKGRLRGRPFRGAVSTADVPGAALLGQCDLVLPLAVAVPVGFGACIVAVRAGNAFLVTGRGHFLCGDRAAAGVAELVIAFLQAMLDGDALVEDEAGAFPQAFPIGRATCRDRAGHYG